MRHVDYLRVLVLLCIFVPYEASASTIADFLERIMVREPQTLSFRETRHVPLIKEPLHAFGEMSFSPPDKLVKKTKEPLEEVITLQGDRLSIKTRESKGYRIDRIRITEHPALQAYVGSVRALLQGDYSVLDQHFIMDLHEAPGAWTLTLTPKAPSMQEHLKQAIIKGEEKQVKQMRFDRPDGGYTTVLLTHGES